MNSGELRALQSPLKTLYRDDPAAARITLRAQGRLGEESITCKVETGKAITEAGLHPATGGDWPPVPGTCSSMLWWRASA